MNMGDLQVGKWRVHLIMPGESYGCTNSAVYDMEEAEKYGNGLPMVEFYDTSQDPKKFPGGQFVSRYYASTMLGIDGYGRDVRVTAEQGRAFSLQGDIPSWTVSPEELSKVGAWLEMTCNNPANESLARAQEAVAKGQPLKGEKLAPAMSLADRVNDAKEVSSGMVQNAPYRNKDMNAR